MCISALFRQVGAPLKNVRWSWGAVRERDGAVFLRVWQDETKTINGTLITRLTANQVFAADDPDNYGYQERLMHVQLVQGGASLFVIMCHAEDPKAHPRQIAGFDRRELFVGGEWMERDGEVWVELSRRIAIEEARQAAGNQ
jgi:hypothetical protein